MPNLLTNCSAQKSESAKLQRHKNQGFGNGKEVFNSNINRKNVRDQACIRMGMTVFWISRFVLDLRGILYDSYNLTSRCLYIGNWFIIIKRQWASVFFTYSTFFSVSVLTCSYLFLYFKIYANPFNLLRTLRVLRRYCTLAKLHLLN